MNKATENICSILSALGIAVNASNIQEMLGLVLTILNIVVLIISLTCKLLRWLKEALKDGKITKDEAEEGLSMLSEGTKELEEATKKGDKKDNG